MHAVQYSSLPHNNNAIGACGLWLMPSLGWAPFSSCFTSPLHIAEVAWGSPAISSFLPSNKQALAYMNYLAQHGQAGLIHTAMPSCHRRFTITAWLELGALLSACLTQSTQLVFFMSSIQEVH